MQSALRDNGAGISGGRRQAVAARAGSGEIALAVVLLAFAGLLTKSCAALAHSNLGYRTAGADVPGWRWGVGLRR